MTLAGRRATPRLQQPVQRLRQEERRLDVEVHDLVPAAFREFLERHAPGGAGVVDQDVELVLMLGESARRAPCSPSTVDTSCGSAMQFGPSSAAVASQASALRDEM